jgi:dTDP-4-dehydrorhamnose 3,5-epimerase
LSRPCGATIAASFAKWFKAEDVSELNFVPAQANLSRSVRDVVRGLHYSLAPEGQAKVVTCVEGEIDDVIVDVRVGSPTFGQFEFVNLTVDSGRSVYLPAGVAHGFSVLSEHAALSYLLSSPYRPALELEIHPLDPAVALPWRLGGEALLSAKDAAAPTLAERVAAGELPFFTA